MSDKLGPYAVFNLHALDEAPTYLAEPPSGGWDDSHKSELLVMRRVDAGSFTMGTGRGEPGYRADQRQREITFTAPFYIGIFAVTQAQWSLLMGDNPSALRGALRPVERVTYPMIRGEGAGAIWPRSEDVDRGSFLGVIRERSGMQWDLPTEAQWEYACRAGTTTSFSNGMDMTSNGQCPSMDHIGRYKHNQTPEVGGYRQHTTVGSYEPNPWGLYDMHGNVWEWCRDWYRADLRDLDTSDPTGPVDGERRVVRGGCWSYGAAGARSAFRSSSRVDGVHTTLGLRLTLPID